MIQIGLPCAPEYLCHWIGWVLAVIALVLVFGLVRIIFREINSTKTKKSIRSPETKIPSDDGIDTTHKER